MPGRSTRLTVVAALAATLLTASTTTHAHKLPEETGKKAYFDTGKTFDPEFRSFAAGLGTGAMLELDFYLNHRWVTGMNASFLFNLDEEDCLDSCRRESRFGVFGERVWGGRWGHVGLRAGPYYSNLYHQFVDEAGNEIAHRGPIYGLQVGGSATFTPVRWAGITVVATALPGVFTGLESSPHCWDCFYDENAEPATTFELTGTLALMIRVGDLDGPERNCPCGPEPTESPDPSDENSAPEPTFAPKPEGS